MRGELGEEWNWLETDSGWSWSSEEFLMQVYELVQGGGETRPRTAQSAGDRYDTVGAPKIGHPGLELATGVWGSETSEPLSRTSAGFQRFLGGSRRWFWPFGLACFFCVHEL